jgi:hypothetical protein
MADALSLLVTYTVEVGSLLRDSFALRLFPDGSILEQPDLLSLADRAACQDGLWNRWFVGWASDAITAAGPAAAGIAQRIASAFAIEHQTRIDRDVSAAWAWLERRSNELCGPVVALTGDLFDSEPRPDHWRGRRLPEARLSGLIADPAASVSQRHDAARVLDRFRSVTLERSQLPPVSVRILGMLMLTP